MTIAFIPARGGSKSIPLKNIKSFGGHPLIYWVLKAAQDCGNIDQIVLATDSDSIKEVSLSFDFSKLNIYDRSPDSASDHASTEQVLLEYLENEKIAPSTDIVLLQATSPFTTSKHIEEAIEIKNKEAYESVLSCVRVKHFYWNQDGTSKNYDHQNRPRRQEFKGTLQENGAIYLSTASQIIKSKNRLSGKIGVYEMPEHTALELDEPLDWLIGEAIMKELTKNKIDHE